MPSLGQMFAGDRFLQGYDSSRQRGMQDQSMQLQQMTSLAALMQQMQQQKKSQQEAAEMEVVKGIVQKTGGDPEKAIQALISTGNPKAIELASKLKGMVPDPMKGMPDIVKLKALADSARARGATAMADMLEAKIRKETQTESAAGQEDRNFLLETSEAYGKGVATPEQMKKATLIHDMLTSPKVVNGNIVQMQLPKEYDPRNRFGLPTADEAMSKFGTGQPQTIQYDPSTQLTGQNQPVAKPIAPVSERAAPKVTELPDNRPLTQAAKLNEDFRAGRISPAQFAALDVGNQRASDELVQAVSDGRVPIPTGFALKSPYWQDVMDRVSKINPKFDATLYGARSAARRTFASGPEARNVTALNTVIGHLGTLDETATAMQNKDVRVVNAVVNRLRTELGDPRIQNFDTAKQAVAEETMRVFRQVGASEIEARMWGDRINSSGSPEQLKGVISTLGQLLESRVEAIAQQYERTVTEGGNPARVDPENKKKLERLVGKGNPIREFSTEAEAAAANLPKGTRVKIGGQIGTWR